VSAAVIDLDAHRRRTRSIASLRRLIGYAESELAEQRALLARLEGTPGAYLLDLEIQYATPAAADAGVQP
jgi:hypothetical protein